MVKGQIDQLLVSLLLESYDYKIIGKRTVLPCRGIKNIAREPTVSHGFNSVSYGK